MEPITLKDPISFESVADLVFFGPQGRSVHLPPEWKSRVEASYRAFQTCMDRREPIYGVTTGFGDSCFRRIPPNQSQLLQENLVRYLTCGTGPVLSRPARRAICLFRLASLGRGLSGVSTELIENLTALVEADWLPLIPAEGSLGASGDLIPLAYLAGALQGWGEIETPDGVREAAELFQEHGRVPYRLKPKEGLALVNGTSAMAGLAYVNTVEAQALVQLSTIETAWLCLALSGRVEPFGSLVNETAKSFTGQSSIARGVREILQGEGHSVAPLTSKDSHEETAIQDRYSLRCAPQILGPIQDTVTLVKNWVETEINGVSDNPLVNSNQVTLASGGNFYGGYLSHGMDYLKISMGHAADLLDRQIMLLVDEKSNGGLPANLANWPGIPAEERSLHHGLKGLHQAISAITSEILSKAIPVGIFSRSSESHNQDKVSLGMGAAVAASSQLDQCFRIHAMSLICLAQALDLKGIRLRGANSRFLYDQIRNAVPFVEKDQALDKGINRLSQTLRSRAHAAGGTYGNPL